MPEKDAMLSLAKEERGRVWGRAGRERWAGHWGREGAGEEEWGRGDTEQLRLQTVLKTVSAQ